MSTFRGSLHAELDVHWDNEKDPPDSDAINYTVFLKIRNDSSINSNIKQISVDSKEYGKCEIEELDLDTLPARTTTALRLYAWLNITQKPRSRNGDTIIVSFIDVNGKQYSTLHTFKGYFKTEAFTDKYTESE